jgi:hypothetical protein
MSYKKPQYPLKNGDDYIYPLTTSDQIIMNDGQRLSGVGVYLDRPDESEDTNFEAGINASSFGGYTFDTFKTYMLNLAHPIGSYYWSSEATNPSGLFGGTWEQIKDRFVLAAGDSYDVGGTGGEAEHTLTISEMPNHYHLTYADPNFCAVSTGNNNSWKQALVNASNHAVTNGYYDYPAGGDQPHNNMPPYLVAYCWRRTA